MVKVTICCVLGDRGIHGEDRGIIKYSTTITIINCITITEFIEGVI